MPLPSGRDGERTISAYDRSPAIELPPGEEIRRGDALAKALTDAAAAHGPRAVIAVDTYPGAEVPALIAQLQSALPDFTVIDVERAAHPAAHLDEAFRATLTDDRVFGVMSHATIDAFYDPAAVAALRGEVQERAGRTLLVGWGATRIADADVVVLGEMARWEIQLRYRRGMPNWHAGNDDEDPLRKIKRGYFLEWRAADRHKRPLFDTADFVLDLNDASAPALISGDGFRGALAAAPSRPFRVVPYFDPGVWGGQWMKQVCGLDDASPNYAWSFDGVPEENSLLLSDGASVFQIPSIDLVFAHPRELLGERTFARFGAEFPIRFDLLDTMEGGNLSLQVHPLTDYIRDRFGMAYTQDESYYLLDAGDDAVVYLGLKTGVDRERLTNDLSRAQAGEISFPADEYVNTFPAKKHDHFAIPAGTVHCSGRNSMVLEISATPYLFTFKMWDWDRVGLDGTPRPIHLDHALANIQWDRDTEWTTENLVDQVEALGAGDGWREERTGLHELEFIEVRRHWFTDRVPHQTNGTVNVLNLVEGAEAVVESPTGSFAPFVVHYAETFIVPAAVGAYTIRPHGPAVGTECATVKASVRGTAV
ncbi:class I mannose-6-phosphate isomerase [Microbacterium sp. W4I20]|uniref:class I mannose-6-phosphate isomerase n=1 Tax=Microbacterium sp. W4I20 TaxID=3042262 RepID=UPI0027853548|nr:class I mannose-6-phosphate isomerase [Microbacterium sp. W4I20]MDQ0727296.1 mannose-6-phosphate isomerase class I [Microbacterium sp. W4I20]